MTPNSLKIIIIILSLPYFPCPFTSSLLYFISLIISAVVVVSIPEYWLKEELQIAWSDNFLHNYGLWMRYSIVGLMLGIIVGTAIALPVDLALAFIGCLVFGLTSGLASGLEADLIDGLGGGIVGGGWFNTLTMYFHLTLFSILLGVYFIQLDTLPIFIFLNLMTCLFFTMLSDTYLGLVLGLGMTFLSFRGPVLLFYSIRHLFRPYHLSYNPYQWDAIVWLPTCIGLNKKLIAYAYKNPKDQNLQSFIEFLFARRSFQIKLAYTMQSARFAGLWATHILQKPEILNQILPKADAESLKKLTPSDAWYQAVKKYPKYSD